MKEHNTLHDAAVCTPQRRRSPFAFVVLFIAMAIIVASSLFIAIPGFSRDLRDTRGAMVDSLFSLFDTAAAEPWSESTDPILLDASQQSPGYAVSLRPASYLSADTGPVAPRLAAAPPLAAESDKDSDVDTQEAKNLEEDILSDLDADDVLAIVFTVVLLGMGLIAVSNKKKGKTFEEFDHARETVIPLKKNDKSHS
ncbi:MAG: hypothetical protein LKJ44_07120 [Bifidobacteriaceae bacterium]|nr:hypothetical protein [Bifidobacteriaceae bacterium]MCI1979457.1 hypothetical protein [Bifidobacteriaceae bacterium]